MIPSTYTVTIPAEASNIAAGYGSITDFDLNTAGPGATDGWYLFLEDVDVVEWGVFITVATVAGNTLTLTLQRFKTMGDPAPVTIDTLTGPALGALGLDTFLRSYNTGPATRNWHFEKGDLAKVVCTVVGGGGTGVIYMKCRPTGSPLNKRKRLASGVEFVVDVDSTT